MKQKIKIITDSTCDLPGSVLEEYDISMMPLTVRFGQESFKDRVDISTQKFFERLKESDEFPATSQVPVGGFAETFKKLGNEYENVLGLFISSKLSGTYQSAVIAKNVLGLDNIHIIDTKLTTFAQGMVVLQAARMARNGCQLQQIIQKVRYMADNMHSTIILGTLTYVEKGGRIGAGTALVGNLLNIMPVVTLAGGEVKFMDKIRGKKKIAKWLLEHFESFETDLSERTVGINHIGCTELVDQLKQELINRFGIKKFVMGTVGSVIGTYSGPDMALGVYFVK